MDDLVDREVDSKGTPKPHPKSVVNKALNSERSAGVVKKKRIMIDDDDDDSEDDIPLVANSVTKANVGSTTYN